MTDKFDAPPRSQQNKPRLITDEPGFVDGIPVEELVRLTREFTNRITNEDRQRLSMEVTETGRSIQSGAPLLLQQFFTGKVDLDTELQRRFPGAPLLSSSHFTPAPGKLARRGFAQLKSQDEGACLNFELHAGDGIFEASFLLGGMIAVKFAIGPITDSHRRRFLDLMRRPNGIAILWSRERWEHDYMVFVVRDRFARVYAFGTNHYDAACRLPPEVMEHLMLWLSGFWMGDSEPQKVDETGTYATW